jgi:hypothetical protein
MAEAKCRMEDYTGAVAALEAVTSNRDTDYQKRTQGLTGNTQTFGSVGEITTLLDEILVQRRIELWGEAGRIFDIQRQKKGWTRYWDIDGMETNHSNYLNKYSEYLHFPADYIECILMIPQKCLIHIRFDPIITIKEGDIVASGRVHAGISTGAEPFIHRLVDHPDTAVQSSQFLCQLTGIILTAIIDDKDLKRGVRLL